MDIADIEHSAGPMSHMSYDSHVITRARMVDTLPRVNQELTEDSKNEEDMEGEILKV